MASVYDTFSNIGHALLRVIQAPRWRSLFLAVIILTVACWTWRSEGDISHAPLSWSRYQYTAAEADRLLEPAYLTLSNITLDLEAGQHEVVPALLKKENPQFHLLIHAPRINAGVCRCLLSSYILDYPPPTLIGYQPSLDSASPQTVMKDDEDGSKDQNGIPDVVDYLKHEHRIQQSDAILVVDGATTLFQLPSEALLSTLAEESDKENSKLAYQYPQISLQSENGSFVVQRFNHSVFFASNRESSTIPAGPSTTDMFGHTQQSTPEVRVDDVLNDSAIIGTAKSMYRLFTAANHANNQFARSDTMTFRTMLAQQVRTRLGVFNPQRQRRSIWGIWKLWLTFHFSVDSAVRAEEDKEARAAAVRDVGIGLDEESKMLYSIPSGSSADQRIGYIESANKTGLEVPAVLNQEGIRRPFAMHPAHLHTNSTATPKSNERDEVAEDPLPDESLSWDQIPLLLNPKTGHIPSVISGSADDVYERLWFQPYARTLLNQYLTRSRSKEVASEAAIGGERWWDSRGGRGGVWTTWGEWIDAGDLCDSFSANVFKDGEDVWEENRKLPEQPDVKVIMNPVGTADGQSQGDEQQEKAQQVGSAVQSSDDTSQKQETSSQGSSGESHEAGDKTSPSQEHKGLVNESNRASSADKDEDGGDTTSKGSAQAAETLPDFPAGQEDSVNLSAGSRR